MAEFFFGKQINSRLWRWDCTRKMVFKVQYISMLALYGQNLRKKDLHKYVVRNGSSILSSKSDNVGQDVCRFIHKWITGNDIDSFWAPKLLLISMSSWIFLEAFVASSEKEFVTIANISFFIFSCRKIIFIMGYKLSIFSTPSFLHLSASQRVGNMFNFFFLCSYTKVLISFWRILFFQMNEWSKNQFPVVIP